jgi:hypothetical protein
MMIVPLAANMPPTPWQTEIFAPGTWAGAMPRIWRTLSCPADPWKIWTLSRTAGDPALKPIEKIAVSWRKSLEKLTAAR